MTLNWRKREGDSGRMGGRREQEGGASKRERGKEEERKRERERGSKDGRETEERKMDRRVVGSKQSLQYLYVQMH